MSATIENSKSETKIHNLFKNMNLSIGVDSDKSALSWLDKHGKVFYGYVNGCWLQKEKDIISETDHHKVCDVFSGKHLCDIYVAVDNILLFHAAGNSAAGLRTWSTMTLASKSKILYNIAQTIEKYQQLFATVEAVSSGKQLSKVKAKDIPDLIESFNYYASCVAQLDKDWCSKRPVCVVAEEYNNPSLNISLRIGSILASGSSVLLLADIKSSLSAFLLAEICSESGLPDGVFNVIPIDQGKFIPLEESPIFSKLIFTGSLERSIAYSKYCAKADIPCDILIPKRPVVIVYNDNINDNFDYHSVSNLILEALFSQDTRCKSGGCKVMVQESICKNFFKVLKKCFMNILVGHNMSKTDISCIVTEEQKKILSECLQEAERIKGDITKLNVDDKVLTYTHMMPTLISNLQTNSEIVQKELGGPMIVVVPFRTVKESISMFNCYNKGSPVNIWINQVSVATEIALKLKTGAVWVNSISVIDAKIPFNGVYSSGNSSEGGKEALFHHMSVVPRGYTMICEEKWLLSSNIHEKNQSSINGVNDSVKEYKLFIGGVFKRSNNGTVMYKENIFIPSATETDIQNAVSSAVAAQPKWESLTDLQKRKFFFDIINQLKNVKEEYVGELQKVSENSLVECEKEFDLALDLLYNLATQNDKFCEPAQEIKKHLLALQKRYPLGVVGIQCPDEKPLLSFVLLIFSAIVHGNAVVAICSELYPIIALKMCEIFSSVNIPNGVINIVCGSNKSLVPALCKNTQVDAIWFTDVPAKVVYANSNVTQRVFCCNKIWTDFNKVVVLKCAIECTYTKTIFLPVGEIFAN